jgi:hypothetical protein
MQGIEFNTEYPTSERARSAERPEPVGWAIGARWILLLAAVGWSLFLLILAMVF